MQRTKITRKTKEVKAMKPGELPQSIYPRAAVLMALWLLLLAMGRGVCELTGDEQLLDKLAQIRDRTFQEPSDYALAEKDALALLGSFSTASDTGQVYLAIEKVYAKSLGTHPGKVAEYCEKALQNPQDADQSCRLYVDWGSALRRLRNTAGAGDTAQARRDAARPFFRAWSVIFTNDVPDKLQDLPAVGRYRYVGPETDPGYLAMVKRHDDQMRAYEGARIKNDLVLCRATVIADCLAQLYRGKSGIADLRVDAAQELHDPAAVDGLVKRVQDFNNGTIHIN